MANVLVGIQTFATLKNDIHIFPFATNQDGVIFITEQEMRAQVSASYASGLMDYKAIESAYDLVEIRLASQREIERAISARTKTWTSLLGDENKRWRNIEELISLYESSNNHLLDIPEELPIRQKIRDLWVRPNADYKYDIHVGYKN